MWLQNEPFCSNINDSIQDQQTKDQKVWKYYQLRENSMLALEEGKALRSQRVLPLSSPVSLTFPLFPLFFCNSFSFALFLFFLVLLALK